MVDHYMPQRTKDILIILVIGNHLTDLISPNKLSYS
jgi:hypothetical protein